MSVKEKVAAIIRKATINARGAEICDPKPRVLRTGIRRPPTQEQRLVALLKRHKEEMTFNPPYSDETDFDIDEPDMLSPHEQAGLVYEMEPVVPDQPQAEGDVSGREEPNPAPLAEQKAEE